MGVTTTGRTQAEGVQEKDAAADIWVSQEGSDRIEGKMAQTGILWTILIIKYYWSDQIKENETVRACGTYVTEEKHIHYFGGEA